MAIRDRLRKLQAGAPDGCPECADWGDGYHLMHDPAECHRVEHEAGFPEIRSLIRAGWFRIGADAPEPGRFGPHISKAVVRALASGEIDIGDEHTPNPQAVAAIAELQPDLWRRCDKPPRGEMPEPCPGCGREPDVVQIVHTHAAGVM
jgi:hypothetical protein